MPAANRGGWRRTGRRERVRIGPLPAGSPSSGQSEQPNKLSRRRLQARRLGLKMAQGLPDLADLARHAGGGHLGDAGSAHNEGAGVHIGEVIATGRRGRAKDGVCTLRTGTDSPVNSDSSACRSSACRSTASAGTRSPSESTTKSPRMTSRPGIRSRVPSADRERARTRRIAQSFQHASLGARLLHDGNDQGGMANASGISASGKSPNVRYTPPPASSSASIG
jgi:hypothetical protein